MESYSRITRWLATAPAWAFSAYAILAAFSTYFCMYGFRKGFASGSYADETAGFFGNVFALMSALVISQLIGYALSKFIGVRINSEMPKARRALALVSCILIAELALLAFALLPPNGKVVAIFFNGLPLGMVWGMVFSFLEGRRLTELLGAGLCCSFIIASGYAKTLGKLLMESGVPETRMPFLTGYDRMIAALGTVATSVFCIMLADALGYTITIGVMIYEQIIGGPEGAKLGFFRNLSYATSIVGSLCILASWFLFRPKIKN